MHKLCINTRDELLIIDLTLIAFFRAEGNYTQLQYIGGETQLLTLGISKLEELIRNTLTPGQPSPFVRLGRSVIFNRTYLAAINVVKQRIVLSDRGAHCYNISAPKPLIKAFKDSFQANF